MACGGASTTPSPPVALDHLGPAVGQHPRASGAVLDCLQRGFEIEIACLSEEKGLRYSELVDHDEDLVDCLDELPGALRPDMRDGRSHGLEKGTGPLDVGFRTSDHDAQGRVLGSLRPAADRGVEPRSAEFGDAVREILGGRRADGGVIDDQRSTAYAVHYAPGTEHDGFDVRSVGYANHHDVVRLGDTLWRFGCDATCCDHGVSPRLRTVPNRDVVAGFDEVQRHGLTHDPEPYKSD
jgi:hypothetical protein